MRVTDATHRDMRLKSFAYLLACALTCVAVGAHGAESSVELTVETGTPDALCPDLSATRRAVRDRIGQLTLEGEKRWVARYTIGHAPAGGGDYVQLVLTDGSGAVRLERRLPLAGESCDTIVQAIALVLERYFRELQSPIEPGPEPVVEEPSEPAPAPAPVAAVPPKAAPADAPPAPKTSVALAPSVQLSLEGGVALGPARGVLGVEAGIWFARWLHTGVQAQLLLPPISEDIWDATGQRRGSARALEVPLRLNLGWGYRGERSSFRAGPALRVSIRQADTHGLVIAPSQSGDASASGASVGVGGGAGATWWLSSGFGLTAALAVDGTIAQTHFQVQTPSGDRRVLSASSVEGQMLIGVAFGATP